jgi:hypothetical protein
MPTTPTCTKGTVCCWLKSSFTQASPGTGEIAAGHKPHGGGPQPPPHPELPFKGIVPVSGWAALVTTLGGVQYDNFKLEGRAPGGGAVASCGSGAPTAGDPVVATPCDAPGTLNDWEKLPGGQLQLSSTTLCIGIGGVLVPCAGGDDEKEEEEEEEVHARGSLVVHDRTTGRITTASDTCLDVTGWPGENGVQWPQAVTNATCGPIPDVNQQYQYVTSHECHAMPPDLGSIYLDPEIDSAPY